MQTIEQIISAGETKNFPCGRFFLLETADENVTLEFFASMGTQLGKAENVKAGFVANFVNEQPTNVSVYSATSQTVKFQTSDIAGLENLQFQGNISELGLIKRDHSNYEQTLLGDCFIGSVDGQSAIGSVYAAGIRNPAGSGKIVLIDKLSFSSDNTGIGATYKNLIVLNGTISVAQVDYGLNKNAGGAASVADFIEGSYTSSPDESDTIFTLAGNDLIQNETLSFKNAIALNPGDTLTHGCYLSTGQYHYVNFEWREIAE